MAENRFDESLPVLVSAAGRRDALRSLGAAGAALLAALGLTDAAARKQRSGGRRKSRRGQHRRN